MKPSQALISGASIATLESSISVLEYDILIPLICVITPPFQLTVNISDTKGDHLQLKMNEGTVTIKQRNSILRALCGSALHNYLDQSPFFLLGGKNANNGVSQESINTMASIRSWMEIADKIRTSSSLIITDILTHLDYYLKNRSFVVPSPSPTLSDLDLYLTVVSCIQTQGIDMNNQNMIHLIRWMKHCHKIVCQIMRNGKNNKLMKFISYKPITMMDTSGLQSTFYFGDEGLDNLKTHHINYDGEISNDENRYKERNRFKEQRNTVDNKYVVKKSTKTLKAKENHSTQNADGTKSKETERGPGESQNKDKKNFQELDISALDIRVGKILKVWAHTDSEKLYCEEIDVGEEQPRSIASGLRSYYSENEMQNRHVLVVCNLKKRNFLGFSSHGMILCACNSSIKEKEVELIQPALGSIIGERIVFDGYEKGKPESENRVSKKKILEAILPNLKTNQNGTLMWKNSIGRTNSGHCFVSEVMANSKVS